MPSTRELLNYLELQSEGWNRLGEKGSLEVLNQAQDLLYSQPMSQTIAYKTDGKLPTISTTENTNQYTLTQAVTGLTFDIWRVEMILLEPPYSNELLATLGVEYQQNPVIRQPVMRREFNGIEYFRFHQISMSDSLRSSHPILTFTIDPGTTTNEYTLLAHKKAIKLTSEQIRSSLPEQLHISALLPAAMKLIEGYQNGNIIEALQFIEKEFKPMVQAEMNEGDQGETNSVVRYEE